VYADDLGKSIVSKRNDSNGAAQIDTATQQLYGIKLARVERDRGKTLIQVFARVVPDETRIYRVNFGTDGYVKETHADAAGTFVKKDQHLATVYSPDFLSVAGGYLAARERDPSPVSASNSQNVSQEAASVQARADRLRNLGMSDTQIQEITRTRKLPEDVYVVSPTDGFILSRNISPGMRFQRQSDLYSIADLSHVWIEAEVYGRTGETLHPGVVANVVARETGTRVHARVISVLPEVDPNTRAIKVRLEADNPGFKLRPNMFVSLEVPAAIPAGISVPVDSILDSGMAKRVFVQVSEGLFEPRTVETGWRVGDRVQVVKGLAPGDVVVASGTFLVDSETRLHPGAI
jgi:membrane fusion protein, copper/silver efflux system